MKNVVGMDFDETLFMTLDAWGESYTKLTGNKFTYPSDYDFSHMDETERKNMWLARTVDMYYSDLVYPNADAMWLVDWFEDHGWQVVVPTHDTETFVEVKEQLLAAYYPTLSGRLVLAKDKWAAIPMMSLLIDDAPHSRASAYPARNYNKGVPAHLRFEDLREVPERLGLSDWKVDQYCGGLTYKTRSSGLSYVMPVTHPMHRPWKQKLLNPYA